MLCLIRSVQLACQPANQPTVFFSHIKSASATSQQYFFFLLQISTSYEQHPAEHSETDGHGWLSLGITVYPRVTICGSSDPFLSISNKNFLLFPVSPPLSPLLSTKTIGSFPNKIPNS